MERQGHVKVFEHRFEHTTATHLLFAQLGLVLVLLGHFHAERGQILRVAGEHIMRGGIGDCHGDRASGTGNTLDQRIHLGAGDVLDRQHRRGFAVTCGKAKLTCLTGAGNADQRGNRKNFIDLRGSRLNGTRFDDRLHHVHGEHALGVTKHGNRLGNGGIVAEGSSIEQRTQLGESNARNAGGSRCGSAESCRIRFESKQVDRAPGGGEQVGGHRVQQCLGCVGVGMQGFVEHRIGALVGERHRPWGGLACEGECVRLAVQSVKKKGVHDVPYLFQKSCDVFLRLRLLTIHPRTLRPSQRLVAVVFGGFAHAFLAGEQFERFDDGFAGLLGVDHGVDFAHFQR